MLLDHQATALGLLHIDDGFMQAVIPGLFGGHVVAVFLQAGLEQAQHRRMLVFFVADQQMQMCAGDPGDQLGALEGQAFRMLGLDDHQDAADGLHGRISRDANKGAWDNYSCCPPDVMLMHINACGWWSAAGSV